MPRLAALLLAALTAATCRAATHTVFWTATTGGTYYAFPSGQSLDDWTTYRVQLTEGASPNAGKYTGVLDDANGSTWFLFSGASQPANWGASVGATTLVVKANAVKIEDADATDTLGTAQTGDSYALLGAPVGASVSADIAAILDDTGTSGVVVAAGTEIEVADADLRAALGMAAADLDTQFASISVTLTAQDISDLTDGLVAGINEALVAVSPDVVTANRTWVAQEYRATNIVEVGDNFAGTLALKPDLNPGTTISTVDSVSITGAATVTATDLTVDRSKTIAHFTVPALATTGTYTVVVTVTTVDGQTIPTTATLKVY